MRIRTLRFGRMISVKSAKSLFTYVMLSALIMALLLTGCKAPEEKVIKIGFIGPLTGDVKTFGESTKNGFQMAIDKHNSTAGGYKIVTVIADDRNDPTEAVNVATKLISQDKVQAIVGSVTSSTTIPVSDVANSKKIVQITGTGTNTKVTVDNGVRKEFVFRACFIDPFQGKVGAKFALDNLKAKTAAVMYDQANDYTKGLAEVFKANFEQGGGEVVAYEAYAKDDSDFSAQLTAIAGKKPDVLYLPDYYQKVSLIGKQARAKGITAPFLGADGWDSSELDFATMEGGYFTNHYSPADARPEVQAWVKEYKAKFGSEPDALGTLAYDATNLLLNAIDTAKSNDPIKIKDAMKATKDFMAVTGKLSFDANGDPVKSAAILQIKDGKQAYVTTVNP